MTTKKIPNASKRLAQSMYPHRTIGFAFSFLLLGSDLYFKETTTGLWVASFLVCFIWPHLAYFIAITNKIPRLAERRNFMIDSFLGGIFATLLLFNLLPMVTMFYMLSLNNISVGGIFLFLKGLGFMLLGIAFMRLFGEYEISIVTNTYMVIICSLLLGFYALSIGLRTHVLARKYIEKRDILEEKNIQIEKGQNEIRIQNESLEVLASNLSKYLSPQVYESIFLGSKDVKLETHRKNLSIFFSDIVGFTSITEKMESEALSSLLNSYLNEMSEIALKHGGTIDKYIGDAIMIFFGDPTTRGEKKDAIACTLMALEMQERMKYLRHNWRKAGISKDFHIRCGINTGFCTVGNFGSDERLDYTVIGGQVNVASHLESTVEADQILISESTYLLVKDRIHCDKKDHLSVKGITDPIQTYQVADYTDQSIVDSTDYSFEEGSGYSLSINFEKANKSEIKEVLQELLKKTDNKTVD